MSYLILYILCIFLIELNESKPQHDGRILFSGGNSGYLPQQNGYRQGSIDEFLAIRSTTQTPSPQQEPCYPQQYDRRQKRSPHFKKKRKFMSGFPVYPVVHPLYVNYQNVNNVVPTKPPYSHYGGYHCGNNNYQPYVKPPIHSNLLSHITNLFFGGIFDDNSQQRPDNNDVKPVYENIEDDSEQNGVIFKMLFIFYFDIAIYVCLKFTG